MPLFVQLTDKKGEQVWHVVESFEAGDPGERVYTCGCGLVETARGDRLLEAENPPWTNRHVYKGCFKTAADKQS